MASMSIPLAFSVANNSNFFEYLPLDLLNFTVAEIWTVSQSIVSCAIDINLNEGP